MKRSIRWPFVPIALAAILLSTSSTPAAEPPPSFYDAFAIAGRYHRQLSLLPALYQGQPETADLEFRRLTQEALAEQREIDVHPCFAEWWAYELMGLELMALSHELRDHPAAVDAEADHVERLGSRMWYKAYDLVASSGEACGALPIDAGLDPRAQAVAESDEAS